MTEQKRLLELSAKLCELRDAYVELAHRLRELEFVQDLPERLHAEQQVDALLARIQQR